MASSGSADLVIVANRLPVDRVTLPDGSHGLAALARRPGDARSSRSCAPTTAPGSAGRAAPRPRTSSRSRTTGMHLVPMTMTAAEIEELLRGLLQRAPCGRSTTTSSRSRSSTASGGTRTSAVNQRFAEQAAEVAAEGATVWVHDYQLQLVPAMLRELRPDLRIGFFLHIPFPPAELFQQLPWRRQILEGLLGADLVGFQLSGAAQNFVRLVRQRVGHKTHRDLVYLPDGRTVRAAAFPISIDSRRLRGAGPLRGGRGARRRDPRGARQPAQGLPRRRPPRLHQGHLRPAARLRRADRGRRARRRGRRVRPGRDARRASGSSSTASCATTSTGWSAGSTATSAGSAGRRSATCTRRTPARRWPRSTGPPTSWSSRRSATG